MKEKHQYLVSGVAEHQATARVSVVIPARNEAQNLQHVLPGIPPIVSEVILIDGHPVDNTIEVAQRLYPSIRIIEQTVL